MSGTDLYYGEGRGNIRAGDSRRKRKTMTHNDNPW
jgi:hypothetical protein